MNDCTRCQEALSSYIDELLDERERQAVEVHVERCAACRRELEELERTVSLLRALPRADSA